MKKIPMFLSTVTVVAGLGTQLLMPGVFMYLDDRSIFKHG